MNISDINAALTSVGQRVSAVAKKVVDANVQKPVAGGNALPQAGQPLPSQTSSPRNGSPQPAAGDLHSLVAQANNAPQVRASNLEFSVAEGTNIDVVRIRDSETGDVIRQIPSEAMVAIARALSEQSSGTMLEEKV